MLGVSHHLKLLNWRQNFYISKPASPVTRDVLVSEGLHEHLTVDNHRTGAHRRQEPSL